MLQLHKFRRASDRVANGMLFPHDSMCNSIRAHRSGIELLSILSAWRPVPPERILLIEVSACCTKASWRSDSAPLFLRRCLLPNSRGSAVNYGGNYSFRRSFSLRDNPNNDYSCSAGTPFQSGSDFCFNWSI